MRAIKKWLQSRLRNAKLSVCTITPEESAEWKHEDGLLRHRSGRFFKIIGLKWREPGGKIMSRPFIDQREIGTLAFFIRNLKKRRQVLVQAKVEPGNIGGAQLAPSYQATKSNSSKAHGGAFPPLTAVIRSQKLEVLYDKMQSEQGTRFYHKRNRNVLEEVKAVFKAPGSHRWVDTEEIFDIMAEDYMINTDARSVLICSPWELLINREPFSRYASGFGRELYESCHAKESDRVKAAIEKKAVSMRRSIKPPEITALDSVKGWKVSGGRGGRVGIRHIHVRVRGREVPHWDQPIIDSTGEGNIILYCGRKKGVLHFLLRLKYEPGLYNTVQLTPAVADEPGSAPKSRGFTYPRGKVKVSCRQSEEGGRFYMDSNRYRIIDTGGAFEPPAGCFWVNMRDIRGFLDGEGRLTNEARSALSLLLKWM